MLYLNCYVVLLEESPLKRSRNYERPLQIDTGLHGIALGPVLLAKVLAIVDRFLVDGIVNALAWVSGFVGAKLAQINARKSQVQLIWMAIFLILVLAFIFLT